MRLQVTALRAVLVGLMLAVCSLPSGAFKLRPTGTDYDRKLAELDEYGVGRLLDRLVRNGVELVAEPVHEEITHRAFLCESVPELMECTNQPSKRPRAPDSVIAGVRWNDNPPFQFTKMPDRTSSLRDSSCLNKVIRIPRYTMNCWLPIYQDGERYGRSRSFSAHNKSPLIQRVHFGDLQFLHSMAASPNEEAQVTLSNILTWARFAFGVYRREFGVNHYFAKCPPQVRECVLIKIPEMPQLATWFPGEMSVSDLFTQGDETYRANLREMALGSLMHMVQDSFSEAHVIRSSTQQNRSCGRDGYRWQSAATIQFFQTYAAQKSGGHAKRDTALSFAGGLVKFKPNVVDVATQVRSLMETAPDWPVLESYLKDCVYILEDGNAQSGSDPDIERSD